MNTSLESTSIHNLPIITLGWVNEDFPVIFHDDETGILTGIYIEMWQTWAKQTGYQLRFVRGDGYGGWDAGPKGWSGVLGLIDNGTVNATLDKYTYRLGRFHSFRSSFPVLYSKDTFFDSRSIEDGLMSIDFIVFPVFVLVLFIVSMIVVTLFERLTFIIRLQIHGKRRKGNTFTHSVIYFVQDYFFLKPSIMSFFNPNSVPYLSFAVYLMASLMISITYQAQFKGNSNIITFRKTLLTELVDALKMGRKALMVASPSLIYDEQMIELYGSNVRNDSFRLQIEPDYDKMAVKVCEDERVYAYVSDYRLSTVDPKKPFRPPCDYVEVDASVSPPNLKTADTIKEEQPFGFYFHKKNFNRRLAKAFDLIVLKFYDYDTIFTFHWKRWTNRPMKKVSSMVEVGSTAVKLSRLSVIFFALLIGLAFSFLVFIIEFVYALSFEHRVFAAKASKISTGEVLSNERNWIINERTKRFDEDKSIRKKSIIDIIKDNLPSDQYESCSIM